MRRNPLRRSLPSFPSLPFPPAARRARSRVRRTGGEQRPRPEIGNAAHPARRLIWPQTTSSLLDPFNDGAFAFKTEGGKACAGELPFSYGIRLMRSLAESAPVRAGTL